MSVTLFCLLSCVMVIGAIVLGVDCLVTVMVVIGVVVVLVATS